MSICLPSLVASLPGIIITCGLVALFCVVLFDTTPTRGRTRTVRFREPAKTERGVCNEIAEPNAPQEDTELDTDDVLFKMEKDISPDSSVCLEIFPKEQCVPGSKVWQVQLMTDAQGDRSSDEKSYVLTFPYLQNTLSIFMEIVSGTSQKRGDVRFSTISKNRKSK